MSETPPPEPAPPETPPSDTHQPEGAEPEHPPIDIRNLSVKCGHCDTYQTLSRFERRDEWNVYTYECENDVCDPELSRTLLEVPRQLDLFARRDPGWRGGKRWGGA